MNFYNKTIGNCAFCLHLCLPFLRPVRTDILRHVHDSVDSKNNTQCLCMECMALLFPRGLHFHGNQTGRKERISAWNFWAFRNKAECRPTASSEFSLWRTAATVTHSLLEEDMPLAGFSPRETQFCPTLLLFERTERQDLKLESLDYLFCHWGDLNFTVSFFTMKKKIQSNCELLIISNGCWN